jgi:Flp pilus assembly protein TadG
VTRSRRKRGSWGEGGSATVEFAMVLPAVAVLLGVIGVATQVGLAAIRAQDAASTAARMAVTDSEGEARAVAREIAGDDAVVTITRDGSWIEVTVTEPAPWGLSGRGSAVARAQD